MIIGGSCQRRLLQAGEEGTLSSRSSLFLNNAHLNSDSNGIVGLPEITCIALPLCLSLDCYMPFYNFGYSQSGQPIEWTTTSQVHQQSSLSPVGTPQVGSSDPGSSGNR